MWALDCPLCPQGTYTLPLCLAFPWDLLLQYCILARELSSSLKAVFLLSCKNVPLLMCHVFVTVKLWCS